MQSEPTGRPVLERIMVKSVWEKTRLPDDFAERYLLFTNLLMESVSSNFMAAEMTKVPCIRTGQVGMDNTP